MKKTKNDKLEGIFQKLDSAEKNKVKSEKSITEFTNNIEKMRGKWVKLAIIAVAIFVLVAVSGTAIYFYWQSKKSAVGNKAASSGSDMQAEKEIQTIKETIGKFLELPSDEEPVLATVTDIEKVKSQKFFANAQNGDKVLIYSENKKAILYRPSSNKIIEVAPLSETKQESSVQDSQPASNVQNESQSNLPANSQTQAETARVVVYNGTDINGLAKNIKNKISTIPGVEVSDTGNADGSYEKTIIIDLAGGKNGIIQKIISNIGGEIGTLPEGETKPDADILIIGGKDFQMN